MEFKADINGIYVASKEVVAREIEGEIIIVPISSEIGDMEDELFSLNRTGKEIWSKFDGKTSLKEIVEEISRLYDEKFTDIEEDVLGLVQELLSRRIIVEIKNP